MNTLPRRGTIQALRIIRQVAQKATINGRSLQDIAWKVHALSTAGLTRRARLTPKGHDKSCYLDVLEVAATSGRTQAENLLDRFHGAWGGSVEPAFRACVF